MLWEKIKEKMMKNPGKKIWENGVCLTYEEVLVLAESFAKKLRAPCCAVLCRSELSAAIALLACFAADVTAVPMSYRYGEENLRKILELVHPPCMLTDRDGTLAVTDTDTGEYAAPEEAPALIMCTSGTTGTPKGVMLSQQNILSNLRDVLSYFSLCGQDRILIARPLYHCAVLNGEFLAALCSGADICFYSGEFNPLFLLQRIQKYQITVMGGTPTLFQLMGYYIKNKETVASLKKLVVSGECLSQSVAQRIREIYSGAQIYHVYGLTEASPRVAFLAPELFDEIPHKISTPLSSVKIRVADANGHEVPAGEHGELLVKGPNVMQGYYKNETLTQKVLAGGWLHTGDIAVKDEQGRIEICGRKDDMIIRAGVNIYPAEIERALLEDPRTEQVLAYGVAGRDRITRIAVKIKGRFSQEEEVHEMCRERLPEYLRPGLVELVKEFEHSGSGKLVRK